MVDEQEASRRRRIIFHAMQDILDDEEQIQAVQVWEEHFHDSPSLMPMSLAGKIREVLGLDVTIQTIAGSLRRTMGLDTSQLAPDPQTSRTSRSGASEATLRNDPEHVVFNTLLSHLLNDIASSHPADIEALRRSLLSNPPLTGVNTHMELLTWCQDVHCFVGPCLARLQPADMSKVIHHIYIWCCEELGPEEAESLLSTAARETTRLPEARHFPPRRLF